MQPLKAQFFLSYAVIGCLVPYLPIYLASHGLPKPQIGQVLAIAAVATILSPVLVTLLADARLSGRILMAALFTVAGAMLVILLPLHRFMPIAAAYLLHSLAIRPALPLQDGLYFTIQQKSKLTGLAEEPYHRVRIFGSIGYMVPSFLLYFLFLIWPSGTWIAVVCGIAVAILGWINAMRLPGDAPTPPRAADARVPTFEAGQRMLQPPLLVFCIAMFLFNIAAGGLYAFYPTYLTGKLHVPFKWVGLISNLGVCSEVGLIWGFGFLVRRFGLKAIMLAGTVGFAIRMGLLAGVPSVFVAVATQLLHGPMVLAIIITPPIFLNHHAHDRFRNSIQGLYTMAVVGTAQVMGYLLAGMIAKHGEQAAFTFSAATSLAAAGLIFVAFKERARA
jgi:PPP family 3-phenylpropionic acid transporter